MYKPIRVNYQKSTVPRGRVYDLPRIRLKLEDLNNLEFIRGEVKANTSEIIRSLIELCATDSTVLNMLHVIISQNKKYREMSRLLKNGKSVKGKSGGKE